MGNKRDELFDRALLPDAIGPLSAGKEETVIKATATLERLHREGRLKPIDGWYGDVLEGYLQCLGLKAPAGGHRPTRQCDPKVRRRSSAQNADA
jgi:hypothetical protein